MWKQEGLYAELPIRLFRNKFKYNEYEKLLDFLRFEEVFIVKRYTRKIWVLILRELKVYKL